MNIKQKAYRIIDKEFDDISGRKRMVIDKIDLLYRKQMEKEIRGMRKSLGKYFWYNIEIDMTDENIDGFNQALQDVLNLLKKETK